MAKTKAEKLAAEARKAIRILARAELPPDAPHLDDAIRARHALYAEVLAMTPEQILARAVELGIEKKSAKPKKPSSG